MKSKQVSKTEYDYEKALEALNRLLYSNGRKGVSIKEMEDVLKEYKVPKNKWEKILKQSALKYL
jgi:hypothetical protein